MHVGGTSRHFPYDNFLGRKGPTMHTTFLRLVASNQICKGRTVQRTQQRTYSRGRSRIPTHQCGLFQSGSNVRRIHLRIFRHEEMLVICEKQSKRMIPSSKVKPRRESFIHTPSRHLPYDILAKT